MKQVLTLVYFLCGSGLFAQGLQLAGLEFAFYPNTTMEEQAPTEEISTQTLGFFLNIPTKLKNKKTILINGIQYTLVDIRSYHSSLFEQSNNQKKLYHIAYSLTAIHQLPHKWSITANIKPIVASDLADNLSSNDFLIQSLALFSKKIRPNLKLGAGLLYTPQSGEPKLWPAIQVKYLHNRHLFNALLPSKVDYFYTLGTYRKARIGARASMNGANFNVSNQTFSNIIPRPVDNIINSRVQVGSVFHCKISEFVLFECWGGISLNRKFRLQDRADVQYQYSAQNGGFFGLGLLIEAGGKP